MSAALSARTRKAAEEATLQFDWLPDKPMLRIAEIAAATGMQSTYLEEYFAEKCHRYPSATGARPAMRVPRSFALALLAESARYSAEEKRDAVAHAFRAFGAADLLQLRAALDAELRRKTGADQANGFSGTTAMKSRNAVGADCAATGTRG